MHNEQWIFGYNFSVFGRIEKSLNGKIENIQIQENWFGRNVIATTCELLLIMHAGMQRSIPSGYSWILVGYACTWPSVFVIKFWNKMSLVLG